jgi:hypothetical protein
MRHCRSNRKGVSKNNDQVFRTYEKESMFRTLGASGMSINKELVKKVRRLLASRLEGTSMADSFTVSNSSNLFI